jgi:O-antigen ligase
MIWLLIGYMWLFVHRPFEVWPWLATLHIERVYMIFTLVYWLMTSARLPPPNRLHFRFALFILAMVVSWTLSPYQAFGEVALESYLKYAVFYFLVVASVRNEHDFLSLLTGYVGSMTLLMVHSLREYYCGNQRWEQGFNRLIPVGWTYDFNDFSALIVCSLPFVWILWRHWKTRNMRILLAGYVGLSIFCVVLTGSRMGAVGLLLASMMACFASPYRWRWMAMYPVLFAMAWIFMPDQQKNRYLTLLGDEYKTKYTTTGNWRVDGFEKGLMLFDQRPLFGFGPMSFAKAEGRGMMPHNLYGQLLAELGLAGTLAFGMFLVGAAQNHFEARRLARDMNIEADSLAWHSVAGMSAIFVMLVIMGWGFNFLFWHVWLWFGGFQAVALECLKRQTAHVQENEAYYWTYRPEALTPRCT